MECSSFILFIFILFTNFAKDNLAGEISQNYCSNNETPKHKKKKKLINNKVWLVMQLVVCSQNSWLTTKFD